MSRWFRVYDDIIDDPKVQRLSPELFRHLINIWCLASRNAGVLPPVSDIAFGLRVKPDKANKILGELRILCLIDDDETGCRPHNWDRRQFKSDGSTERVKRFRNAQRNGDETLHHPFPKQDQTTETETEQIQIQSRVEKKERARGALAPGWPDDYAEVFWEAFPNKVGKQDAFRKLEKLAKAGAVQFSELMEALRRYANKTDDRPFCNPATWIHQGRWTDVPATNSNAKRTIQQAAADQLAMFRAITGKDRVGNEAGDPPVRLLPARGRQ